MPDAGPTPYMLPERLRQIKAERRWTIQEMANATGLPKGTLESYMRTKEPKKPGLDALRQIAQACEVSLDWLVGRALSRSVCQFSEAQAGMVHFRAVRNLLAQLVDAHSVDPHSAIERTTEGYRVLGYDISELAAAEAMAFAGNLQAAMDDANFWPGLSEAMEEHFDALNRAIEGTEAKREP